jgi:hypothetical protein
MRRQWVINVIRPAEFLKGIQDQFLVGGGPIEMLDDDIAQAELAALVIPGRNMRLLAFWLFFVRPGLLGAKSRRELAASLCEHETIIGSQDEIAQWPKNPMGLLVNFDFGRVHNEPLAE